MADPLTLPHTTQAPPITIKCGDDLFTRSSYNNRSILLPIILGVSCFIVTIIAVIVTLLRLRKKRNSLALYMTLVHADADAIESEDDEPIYCREDDAEKGKYLANGQLCT